MVAQRVVDVADPDGDAARRRGPGVVEDRRPLPNVVGKAPEADRFVVGDEEGRSQNPELLRAVPVHERVAVPDKGDNVPLGTTAEVDDPGPGRRCEPPGDVALALDWEVDIYDPVGLVALDKLAEQVLQRVLQPRNVDVDGVRPRVGDGVGVVRRELPERLPGHVVRGQDRDPVRRVPEQAGRDLGRVQLVRGVRVGAHPQLREAHHVGARAGALPDELGDFGDPQPEAARPGLAVGAALVGAGIGQVEPHQAQRGVHLIRYSDRVQMSARIRSAYKNAKSALKDAELV